MSDKHQRVIHIDDKELQKLIGEKGTLVEQGRTLSREMQQLQQRFGEIKNELDSLAGKVGTTSRRIFKRVKSATKGKLAEWEMPLTTEIRDGKVVLIVEDALETFKDQFKQQDKFGAPKLQTKK